MGRVMAVDWGTKRVGIALTDVGQVIASPHSVLARSRSREGDLAALARLVRENGVERVVLGLPLNMDGTSGPAARKVEELARLLRERLRVPVETLDERLTTWEAEKTLMEGNLRSDRRRRIIDKMAAALILQAWLDKKGLT